MDCYVVNPISQSNLAQALSHVPHGHPDREHRLAGRRGGGPRAGHRHLDLHRHGQRGRRAPSRPTRWRRSSAGGASVGVIGGISGDATSAARIDGFTDGRAWTLRPARSGQRGLGRAQGEARRQDPAWRRTRDRWVLRRQRPDGARRRAGRRRRRTGGSRGRRRRRRHPGRPSTPSSDGAMSATVSQYPYTIGRLGVEACLAAASGASLPGERRRPHPGRHEAERGARAGEVPAAGPAVREPVRCLARALIAFG